jgi:hypothetical protein
MVDIGPQLWHPEYVGKCGRSSVVERYLAKVDVVSSSLIARFQMKERHTRASKKVTVTYWELFHVYKIFW